MNRPTRLVTLALSASAALLLTACGSGGGSDSAPGKIKGADGASGKASAPAGDATSAAPGGAKRPVITFPGDFRADFEGWTNSDPKLQAILNDGREQLKSEYAAIIAADPTPTPDAVAFYNSGASLASTRKWIKSYVDTDDSLTGKIRVFSPQVQINDTGSGVLFYCVDEGKAYTKNRKTKKVTGTPDDVNPKLQYRTTLNKTSQGVWKTVTLETARGGMQVMRASTYAYGALVSCLALALASPVAYAIGDKHDNGPVKPPAGPSGDASSNTLTAAVGTSSIRVRQLSGGPGGSAPRALAPVDPNWKPPAC
ncbi:hypothetical protein [Streptomyces sp. NBC_01089]|uniref:hypothetical protein n=1 Tax=Streptomyces sp. NBC_01089 TaxID=2903747 RepID=UPI0038632FAF